MKLLYNFKEKKEGYIYVIKSFGLYKIGCANNLTKRLSIYYTHNPNCKCIFSRKVWGYRKVEKKIHHIFTLNRVYGEWFRIGNGGLSKIKFICGQEAVEPDKDSLLLKESV